MLFCMLVSLIEIIKHLIHPSLVGVTKSNQAHERIKEVVHHMALVEEQRIIDELLDSPTDIIIHI